MAPKAKPAAAPAANGSAKTPANGKAVSAAADKADTTEAAPAFTGGKPDKKAYDEEQERIKAEIEALQAKLSAVRDKIPSKGSVSNERRNQLRAELDGLRGQQTNSKNSRGKVLDQIKALNESVSKKIKDIQAAQTKIPYKSVAEVDTRIKALEKQVESGNLKLAEEKRAVAEISTCKRNRRTVEGFQSMQEAIEADRKTIDELKKQLDDPEWKATSERFDVIKAELDELKKQGDDAYAGRTKLFEERDGLQAQINALWDKKREASSLYREANDKYWAKVNEDRARRAERMRAQRAAEEADKKREVAERLREEAETPAYQFEIEDCQTLIDHFSGKSSGPVALKTAAAKAEVAGVPKLELRQVEAAPEGLVVRKKKGEDEDNYFVSSKGGKSKGKKGNAKSQAPADAAPSEKSDKLNLPFATLAALMEFSIPPPTSSADTPRVITDLQTKKAWFEANSERATKENIARAEAQIKKLAANAAALITPEVPAEPTHTPQVTDTLETPVSTEAVDAKLETVEEQASAADS